MRVLREDTGQDFTLAVPPLARGGEAAVYALAANPSLVAKVYHRPTPEGASKLAAMIAFPPADTDTWSAARHVAWPVSRLLGAEEQVVVGYLMPRVENARRIVEFTNPRARLHFCPLFHYGYLLRTARNLAAAVSGLHERGFVLGDLNESNVLVNPQAHVTLVDADSFQVPGPAGVFRCRVGKAEYTPPELQDICLAGRDLGPEHDAFALGVLIFQLLMQGLHPFAGVSAEDGDADPLPARIRAGWWPYAWKRTGPVRPAPQAPPWAVLPPAVQELFTCCFEDGHADPGRRPGAAAWQQALEEAEGQMAVCASNSQHRHPRGLDVCPWCVLARDRGRDPFPSAEQVQTLRATRLANRTALHPSGLGLPQETAPPAARPQLDPDDPLPPRAVEVRRESSPEPLPLSRKEPPAIRPPSSRAVWVAAGAIGAILGIVAVLMTYEPLPPNPRAEATESAPPHRPPARPALVAAEEAEQAWKQAVADCQEAQKTYEQFLRQYQQSLQDFARKRATRAAVAQNLEKLREQALVVQQRQRVLAEKTRLREETRQALLRDRP
jgi:DNA-binding helix-hairpin-helix protein with protein kinase domain